MNERTQLRAFVSQLLQSKGDTSPFEDAESLAAGGRLDSIEIIRLVGFMEEAFGVDFSRVEFNRAHFDSIATMSDFLSRCGKGGAQVDG